MTTSPPHRPAAARHVRRAAAALLALALLVPLTAAAQPQVDGRVGDDPDPVRAAILLSQAAGAGGDRVVLGRSDAFPDVLAATALAGADGALLLTDGGPDAPLRPEVADELDRRAGGRTCEDAAEGPTAVLAGGELAVSAAAAQAVADRGWCTLRAEGETRVETAVAVGEAVLDPSGTVLLARADDWADAGAVGAWAAWTRSRVLVTQPGALHPAAAAALEAWAPDRVVLVGGEEALGDAVEAQVRALVPDTARVAGEVRAGTAVAIAEQLWADDRGTEVLVAEGYGDDAWTTLFTGSPLAAVRRAPILYLAGSELAPETAAHLDGVEDVTVTAIGPRPDGDPPPTQPPADLEAAVVALVEVARLDAPITSRVRPGSGEVWVAERAGRVRTLDPDGGVGRLVLDISSTVSTSGERGLLGLAFDRAGDVLYTSSTDLGGTSVLDAFDVVGEGADAVADPASRRELLRIDQPASNHNGGDLHLGPDGHLWWAMGDGGGGGDTYEQGQRPDTLLAALLRLDVAGAPAGAPYAIPADNPFADGQGGAPEVWAYGLRNPWRIAFDEVTGDLYIADVGQSAVEEINHVPAGTGAGSNFGWPIFEGTRPFRGGSLPDHVPPVWEELHADGSCSITGGVVYRGTAIPELTGAYLYSDLCRNSIRAILVEDGEVTQVADLGVAIGTPVGFGVDADGEVHVLSLEGPVVQLVPAG